MKKIVIKIGSQLLATSNGLPDINNLRNITFQIATILKEYPIQVIVVSSGAIICGAEHIGVVPASIPEKQAAAAVGQPLLIQQYQFYFKEKGCKIAQLLLTKDVLVDSNRQNHAKNTIFTLLSEKVIPIINENDSVSIDEICFGDNDKLAGTVSALVDASQLILLTNTDGVYSAHPRKNENAELIPVIRNIDDSLLDLFTEDADIGSRGGIKSKLLAAKYAAEHGISSVIANGRSPNILYQIMNNTANCTYVDSQ